MSENRLRRWRTRLAMVGAAAAVVAAPSAAHAVSLTVEYDAVGTSSIASTGSTINLGPTSLTTTVEFPAGPFTGHMPLPGTATKFEVIGFIPVTANVDFVEAAPVQGTIGPAPQGGGSFVSGNASYYIKLSNIKIVGFPTISGTNCRTEDPVNIPISTPAGETFNVFNGGNLSGEFSIGDFQNCGLNTWLINLLIPGGGNTVDVVVNNGRRIP